MGKSVVVDLSPARALNLFEKFFILRCMYFNLRKQLLIIYSDIEYSDSTTDNKKEESDNAELLY